MELSCRGDFRSLCEFFDRLAKAPRLCHVESARIDADGGPLYRAELTLRVFFGLAEQREAKAGPKQQ